MKKSVNQRIKFLRVNARLTQKEFANYIGCVEATLSRIENGVVTPQKLTLDSIINKFHLKPEWLLEGKGELSFQYDASAAQSPVETSVWQDEAYNELKRQNEFLQEKVNQFMSIVGNLTSQLGKLDAPDQAEFLRVA